METRLTHLMTTLGMMVLLLMGSSYASAKDKMVRRGMTKVEVEAVLGKPKTVAFDKYGETWTYLKYRPLDSYDKMIFVGFSGVGRVVNYSEQLVEHDGGTTDARISGPMAPMMPPSQYGAYIPYSLTDGEFNVLYQKVKAASFEDNRLDLIEVASLAAYYTCGQCARLLQLFNFDDTKLQALRLMASHIVDPQNVSVVTETLSFDTNKDKALQILRGI